MNLPTKQADGSGRFYEYVIDNIRQMIADGELQAGQKLPSERELAEKFNVSRVPIREALKILEYMGVLDSSPGDRHLCEEHLRAEPGQQDEFLLRRHGGHHPGSAGAAYRAGDLRGLSRRPAAHRRGYRLHPEAAPGHAGGQEGQRRHRGVGAEPAQALPRFHQALVRAAHNAVLSSVYEYLYELLDISRQFTINNSGISYSSIVAHEALFSKVIEGDAEGARQCMEEHMEDVRYNLRIHHGNRSPGTEGPRSA